MTTNISAKIRCIFNARTIAQLYSATFIIELLICLLFCIRGIDISWLSSACAIAYIPITIMCFITLYLMDADDTAQERTTQVDLATIINRSARSNE